MYDRSRLYSLDWLTVETRHWANMHAGLDETTASLKTKYPHADGRVLDIFDSAEMTEPSIARARALSQSAGEAACWSQLPARDGEFDMIFLPFVAHEFRKSAARHIFFCELARVLAPRGKIILVEHLRDMANLLAFGPGFLHFQSRRTWSAALEAADLRATREFSITPFVRVFEIEPDAK